MKNKHMLSETLSFCLPEEGLPREPDTVLVDGFPGEEQEQQQHGDTEDCGSPTANHRTQPTQAMSYQDTVAHTRRGEEMGRMDEGKTEVTKKWRIMHDP